MSTIKGPLYYRINTNGAPIPVKSTGFMSSISQVNSKIAAENRIRLGQKSGVIPKGQLESEWTRYEDGKWLVTISGPAGGRKRRTKRRKTRKTRNRRHKKTRRH